MKLGNTLFSECGTYRYTLTRKIPQPVRWVKNALFIMLYPSTADEFQNDPTITRCINFASREGCTDLTIVNLFALRSTDPKMLKIHSNPVGPKNQEIFLKELEKAERTNGLVVTAWGANPLAEPFNRELRGLDFHCLCLNKNGSPKHPLYVKSDKELELFR